MGSVLLSELIMNTSFLIPIKIYFEEDFKYSTHTTIFTGRQTDELCKLNIPHKTVLQNAPTYNHGFSCGYLTTFSRGRPFMIIKANI